MTTTADSPTVSTLANTRPELGCDFDHAPDGAVPSCSRKGVAIFTYCHGIEVVCANAQRWISDGTDDVRCGYCPELVIDCWSVMPL